MKAIGGMHTIPQIAPACSRSDLGRPTAAFLVSDLVRYVLRPKESAGKPTEHPFAERKSQRLSTFWCSSWSWRKSLLRPEGYSRKRVHVQGRISVKSRKRQNAVVRRNLEMKDRQKCYQFFPQISLQVLPKQKREKGTSQKIPTLPLNGKPSRFIRNGTHTFACLRLSRENVTLHRSECNQQILPGRVRGWWVGQG